MHRRLLIICAFFGLGFITPTFLPAQTEVRERGERPPRVRDDRVRDDEVMPPAAVAKALKSTCWIFSVRDGKPFYGTGWVVDKWRKQVLTNNHVILADKEIYAFFPLFKDGKLLAQSSQYKGKGIAARLVKADVKRDLALLQLDQLPADSEELTLAEKPCAVGQKLYSIGNSPMSNHQPWDGKLWHWREGKISKVGFFVFVLDNTKAKGEARTIETDSGIQAGDSGGPMLDERGELAGIASSYKVGTPLSWSIHCHEIRAFLHNVRKSPREYVTSAIEGHWTLKFNSKGEDKFAGLIFHDNGKVIWDGFSEMFPGTYSFKDDKLALDIPGLKIRDTVTVTWEGADTFRFTSELEFTCTRR